MIATIPIASRAVNGGRTVRMILPVKRNEKGGAMNEQDALDQLYEAVQRLKAHGCDQYYILNCVRDAYEPERDKPCQKR